MTLASWLLAAAPAMVEAQLELIAEGQDHLALRLCVSSPQAHQVEYRLEVATTGAAGTSRTRQSGKLTSRSDNQCPINNRLGLSANGRVDATLDWWVDGQAQPRLQRSHPPAQPTGPTPPPPSPPQDELHEAEGLVASAHQTPGQPPRR